MQWVTIPCIIKDHLSDIQARVLNLTENVNRKDLNMLQEAKAIQNLVVAGLTQEEIGTKIHQSRGWVQVRCYLLTLPPEIQEEAAAGNLSYQQIRDLYTIGDKNQQYEAVKKIKDAKERGEKTPRVAKQNKNTLIKKRRERGELFAMMDHIREYLGNNLSTRALAWAAGEITDNDLFHSIKEECEIEGVNYEIPKEALSPVS
jgi:ParB family chromosome partitioning protein